MALALKSNVYSDVYITGNCIVGGTVTSLANPVNSLMTILQDQKTSGSNGGSATGAAWNTRTLNTSVIDQIGVSLGSNQFTLPAGTYHVQISTPACQVNNHRCRLYNVTTSSTVLLGTSECAQNTNPSNMSNRSFIDAYFTSAASGTYRVDHWCNTSFATQGLGMNATSGDVEIYTTVKIIKINSGAALNQWTTGGTAVYYNSGNVGVGTTIPTQINGSGAVFHVYETSTNAPTIRIDATGGTGQARLHVSAGNGANYRAGRIDFFNFPTSTTVPTNTLISDYDQNGTNNLDFVNFANTRTMTIKQSGYVGIGTSSPENKFDVTDGSIVVAPTTFGGAANYGLFFRHGFSGANYYNCSVMAYDHNGDTNPDGVSINGYDGVSICTGSNARQERIRVTQAGFLSASSSGSFSGVSSFDTVAFDLVNYNVVEITMSVYFSTTNLRVMSSQLVDTAGTASSPSESGWQVFAGGTSANYNGTGANIINNTEIIGNAVGGFIVVVRVIGNMGLAQNLRNHWEWTATGCYASLGASTTFGRAMIQNPIPVVINRVRFNLGGGTMTGKYSIFQYNT